MPFIRKGTEGLGENPEAPYLDARLARPGGEALPLHADEVADIELGRNGQRGLVDFLGIHIDLHSSPHVREIEKTALPHVTIGGDASRERNEAPLFKSIPHLGDRSGSFKESSEGIDAEIADGLKFLPTDGNKLA